MGELQNYFFGHRIFFSVDTMSVSAYMIEAVAIRMYKQLIFSTGHSYIVSTHKMVVF